MISSPFHACAKQMFTSVFTNKYIVIHISFRIVSFYRFLFISCTRNKTFSEEIQETRKRYSCRIEHLPNFPPSCTENCLLEQDTSCNFIRKIFFRVPANKDGGSCAERTGDHLWICDLIWAKQPRTYYKNYRLTAFKFFKRWEIFGVIS